MYLLPKFVSPLVLCTVRVPGEAQTFCDQVTKSENASSKSHCYFCHSKEVSVPFAPRFPKDPLSQVMNSQTLASSISEDFSLKS
jgi:hypothetical protein